MKYVEEHIDPVEEYREPDSAELEDILSREWEWEGYEPDFEDDEEVGRPGYVVVCEAMSHGHRTEYQLYGDLHRFDGPAKILSYPDGVVIAEWWEYGAFIRRRVGGLDILSIQR